MKVSPEIKLIYKLCNFILCFYDYIYIIFNREILMSVSITFFNPREFSLVGRDNT